MNPKCTHCGGNTYEIGQTPAGLVFRCFDCRAAITSPEVMAFDYP